MGVPSPFNPTDRKYRACCCHTKSFTLVFGIVENFIICFLLVSVIPDFNAKICMQPNDKNSNYAEKGKHTQIPIQDIKTGALLENTSTNGQIEVSNLNSTMSLPETDQILAGIADSQVFTISTSTRRQRKRQTGIQEGLKLNIPTTLEKAQNAVRHTNSISQFITTDNQQQRLTSETEPLLPIPKWNDNLGLILIHQISCSCSIIWIFLAIIQIIAINVMFYGIKNLKYKLFIPHIILRIMCWFLCFLLIILLIIVAFSTPLPKSFNLAGLISLIVFFLLVSLWVLFLIKCEVRCCEFVKKSAETGFSVSNIRTLGQRTISFSETTRYKPSALPFPSANVMHPTYIVQVKGATNNAKKNDFATIPTLEIKSDEKTDLPTPSFPKSDPFQKNGSIFYQETGFQPEKVNEKKSMQNDNSLPPLRHTYKPR